MHAALAPDSSRARSFDSPPTPTPLPEGFAAAHVRAIAAHYRLTRAELSAYCAERFDLIAPAVAHLLNAARLVEDAPSGADCDDGVAQTPCMRPASLNPDVWRELAQGRLASLAWFRQSVALSGPFARGARVVDVARTMRGQNPFGLDLFGWMACQRAVDTGERVAVELGPDRMTLPVLDPTRVELTDSPEAGPFDLMSGNDYLGLRVHPEVRAAALACIRDEGVGSGGSRMLSGTSPAHRALERAIAVWKGTEDAALFNSGWHANVAVMSAFTGPGTVVFSDALNHASIIDGLRMSGAEVEVFAHNDPADLARRIEAVRTDPRRGPAALAQGLVVVEGVYSMDGDTCALAELLAVAAPHGLTFHVDEAHSALVLGARGKGIAEHAGVSTDRVALQMGTLSKAFGGEGGYVAGRAQVIEALKLLARPFWFSTALPAASAAAAQRALEIAQAEPSRRERLWRNAARVREALTEMGYDTCGSTTWIVPVRLGDEARTALLQHALREAGILASAVFAPAVPRGQERVRLSLSAAHTDAQLDRMLGVFRRFAGA